MRQEIATGIRSDGTIHRVYVKSFPFLTYAGLLLAIPVLLAWLLR
jgi:hypothetical protein